MVSSFFIFPSFANAGNEFITGFDMSSCSLDKCYTLTAEGIVEKGFLAPIFAFAKATLVSENNGLNKTYHAKEGYYDSKNSEIILREVQELQGGEVIVDLISGNIKMFATISKK